MRQCGKNSSAASKKQMPNTCQKRFLDFDGKNFIFGSIVPFIGFRKTKNRGILILYHIERKE